MKNKFFKVMSEELENEKKSKNLKKTLDKY